MAISHVCNSCGFDLARVAPFQDASLRLPIVVCPTCAHACVRRRHPIHEVWRKARRIDAALSILLVQCLFAAALLGTTVGMIYGLGEIAQDRGETMTGFLANAFNNETRVEHRNGRIIRHDDGRDAAVVATAVFSAMCGVWLTATMAHLRFWRRWATWAVILVALVSMNWVGWVYETWLEMLNPSATVGVATPGAEQWLGRLLLLGGCLLVMLIASPVGLPVRWILGVVRGAMWRRQLRRARYSRGRDA